MDHLVTVRSALISVFNKSGIDSLIRLLSNLGVTLYSTGGTQKHIESLGVEVIGVENITSFPEILGGRVKTLHPHVFGGILYQRQLSSDVNTVEQHSIPPIDLVIVDLYPFEETLKASKSHEEIIEKIDIGGVSLIRAAAKNYHDVVVVSDKNQYPELERLLLLHEGNTTLEERRHFAGLGFQRTSIYDQEIQHYITSSIAPEGVSLRYGENPHQNACFEGNLEEAFIQLNGKELSYNNLLDIDAAFRLMHDFPAEKSVFAILKHTNACGLAVTHSVVDSYQGALEADPLSAFGGILISNQPITLACAKTMHSLFFEVLIAPDYQDGVLELLAEKKNRIILKSKHFNPPSVEKRTALTGQLVQSFNDHKPSEKDFSVQTKSTPTAEEISDLVIANILVKHTKSNAIILVKNQQLLASGTGQTSRVDALKQAVKKARHFNLDLHGAVMASDAFFPFPDCVLLAHEAGITSIVQPGGSIKDQLSIDACDNAGISMVFTGIRHFKH